MNKRGSKFWMPSADMKQFYLLANKQRGKLRYCVNELFVDDEVYKTESEFLNAWRRS